MKASRTKMVPPEAHEVRSVEAMMSGEKASIPLIIPIATATVLKIPATKLSQPPRVPNKSVAMTARVSRKMRPLPGNPVARSESRLSPMATVSKTAARTEYGIQRRAKVMIKIKP